MILVDSNLLLRFLADQASPQRKIVARDAILKLNRRGEQLAVVPQNVYEFWVVATHPARQTQRLRNASRPHRPLAQLYSAAILIA